MFGDDYRSSRTPTDVLFGRLPIRLAGRTFVLPVLTTGENEAWQASLDELYRPVLAAEGQDFETALAAAETSEGTRGGNLLGLIYSYDKHGVLPSRSSIEADIYPHEILAAVFEVRLAANPTVAWLVASAMKTATDPNPEIPETPPSAPTNGRRRRTAGRRPTSVTT